MAQFDVYTNPMVDQVNRIPYWLNLRSDHIDQLASRVIIPLRNLSNMGPRIDGLRPLVTVGKQQLCADVPSVASFAARLLKTPHSSVADQRHDLIAASGYLISGF